MNFLQDLSGNETTGIGAVQLGVKPDSLYLLLPQIKVSGQGWGRLNVGPAFRISQSDLTFLQTI